MLRSLYRYNDPGFTVRGPVWLPKLHTKDKLFFFWSEEWQKQLVPNTPRNIEVPTAFERLGDFSQSVDSNNKPLIIKDPNSGLAIAGNKLSSRAFCKTLGKSPRA